MSLNAVKLYFKDEIRRFSLESLNYQILIQKVVQLYPDVVNAKLAWKDEEGDLITLTNDDELKEALKSKKGDLLHVYLYGSDPNGRQRKRSLHVANDSMEDETDDDSELELHKRVYCNGCESQVKGSRYKCLICPNYDLCEKCSNNHVHDQHPMIRIANRKDKSWRRAFRNVRKSMSPMEHGLPPGIPPPFGHHGPHHHGRHHGPPHHHGRHGPPHHGPFLHPPPMFGFNGPVPLSHGQVHHAPCPHPHFSPFTPQPPMKPHHRHWRKWARHQDKCWRRHEKAASADRAADGHWSSSSEENDEAPFLKNIGDMVSAALHMFGIDADVDIVEPNEKRRRHEESTAEAPAADNTDVQVEDTAGSAMDVNTEPGTAAFSTPSTISKQVQMSLDQMLSMGFTNENDWLKNLLIQKDGNISAVLEALNKNIEVVNIV